MSNETKNSPFRFVNYQIIDSRISRTLGEEEGELDIDIDLKGSILPKDKNFVLEMKAKFKDGDFFSANVSAVGFFEFKDEISENIGTYFYINAPALLFPHIRAYISALTALSGMSTVLIPAMNLSGLAEELKENTTVFK